MKTTLFTIMICMLVIFYACSSSSSSTANADSTAAITEATPATAKISIANKKWKLIELMGQPVADSINGKEAFIMFEKADSTYAANGGCNGLGGGFILDEKTMHIQFKQGMSTMMACPDMSVEDGLKKVLTEVDNYTLGGDTILSLNKARMAPLARFRAAQ